MIGRPLVFEDFADRLNDVFVVSEQHAPAIPLVLTEAKPIPGRSTLTDIRPPFSLLFSARDPRVLQQKIYRLEHDGLGALEMFLVPVGKDRDGVRYQAIFN